MTDTELYAQYAKTSHVGDVDFFLRNCNGQVMDRAMRKAWLGLRARAPRMAKRKVQGEYRLLLSAYWRLIGAMERATHPTPRFIGGHYANERGEFSHGWRDRQRGDIVWTATAKRERELHRTDEAA